MIIYDLNQIAFSSLMSEQKNSNHAPMNIDMLRHLILGQIAKTNKLFPDRGQVVIAIDGRKSWRKQVFKHYKASRGKTRTQLGPNVDWGMFYDFINQLGQELQEYFPYVVIQNERAEGDDVVAVITRKCLADEYFEQVIIVSSDKDFKQLHDLDRVKQYTPVSPARFVTTADPKAELNTLIVCGDMNDGVPNILSEDHAYVANLPRPKMTAKRKLEFTVESGDDIEDLKIRRNWYRNKVLVDLSCIPADIQQEITEEYERQKQVIKERGAGLRASSKMYSYFVINKLTTLERKIGDFV